LVHLQKINILGEQFVGKSSLISLMENYDSDSFQIDFNSNEESFYALSSLVEEIKEIKINYNKDKYLYFNVYESNIDNFDLIKLNLEPLLLQTECIIIIWDNNCPKTFVNIPNLISTIEFYLKQSEIKFPIFVIQNKMDLDLQFDEDEISYSKDKFFESIKKLKENSNINYKEISLTNKNNFYELISDIESKLSENSFQKKNNTYNVKYYYPLKRTHQFNKDGIYLNCILLGGEGSGKDSFLNCLVGESTSNIWSTIEINSLAFNFEVNGEKIYLKFLIQIKKDLVLS